MAVPSHETTAAVGVSPPSRVGCSWLAWSSPPVPPVSEEHKHLARGAPPGRVAAPGSHLPPPAGPMQSRTHLDGSRRSGSPAFARGVDGGLAQACPRVTEHTEFSIPKREERWVSIGLRRHCPSSCGKVWNRRRASRHRSCRHVNCSMSVGIGPILPLSVHHTPSHDRFPGGHPGNVGNCISLKILPITCWRTVAMNTRQPGAF